jgi:hypothetical protein
MIIEIEYLKGIDGDSLIPNFKMKVWAGAPSCAPSFCQQITRLYNLPNCALYIGKVPV